MVYMEKFLVSVKVDGKILRERDGKVVIPFGSQFSILLKNLESRKASVWVSIDGKDVLNGRSLIIGPDSSIELERFIDDSLDHGNRFRFIQKTQEIVDHRGDRIDDGLIRVKFAFEQRVEKVVTEHIHYDHYYPYAHPYVYYPTWTYHTTTCRDVDVNYTAASGGNTVQCCSMNVQAFNSAPLQDEGITVKGSESNQHFQQGYIGNLDQGEVIIIRLSGEMPSGKQAEKPIFVKDKLECGTCGRKAESVARFCGNCGTAL